MITYDIKSDMPSTLEAGTRLSAIIKSSKSKQLKVIKIYMGMGRGE